MPMKPRWSSKFEVKKGSWVFVPTEEAISYGKAIKLELESHWTPPSYYYHLRDGGHVKALSLHKSNQFYIHLDISNFFGCINKSRVTRCLKGIYPYSKAREIAVESTVKNPSSSEQSDFVLPFGFVQSPILASLCLQKSKLGKYLSSLNKIEGVSVSVYMDDVVISSDDMDFLQNVMEEIKPIADRSKFTLNEEKEEGPSSQITAFNIELSNGVLKLTERRLKEFIRSYRDSESFDVISGIVGYVETVNKNQADKIV